MSLGVCIGTNDVVEPMIKPQWFVNCKTMAKAGLDALKSKKIEIIPQHSGKKLDRWLGNTHDWCVSRQLWCGHPLPAWYVTLGDDQDKKIGSNCDRWIVARSESDANVEAQKKYPGKTFRLDQDTDVLDTWFSYGLFLLTTLGWPEENAEMRAFFLTSVLDTEVDNLLMWVARMVMMGVQLVGDVPFQKVYLHPTVCDKSGKKMSKSLGNFIDPLEVINGMSLEDLLKTLEEEGNLDPNELNIAKEGKKKQFPDGIVNCGADALRFGLISYTSQCASINFDTSNIVKCRRSCSKLWNSFHVGLSILGDYTPTGTVDVHFIPPICNWILSVLNKAVDKTVTSLEAYRLSDAASAISSWWQHDFDIFLEAIPVHGSARAASRDTLWFCLDCGLRLLHPFMPYVTEELWQRLPQPKDSCRKESIMISEYPSVTKDWSNGNLENEMAIVFAAAEKIKSLKPSADSNERQHAFALCRSREMVTTMLSHRSLTAQLSSIPHLKIPRVNDKAPDGCAAAVVNKDLTVYRQYKGAFNTNGEREKLRKKRDEVLKLQEALTRKMNDSIYQENVTKKIKEGDTRNLRVLLEKLDVISECEMELDAVKESFESPLSLKINATCKPESLPEMSELGHAAPIALDQGAQIEERFLAFLRGFKLNGHLFYKNVCEALCSMQSNVISIDYGHLKLFDPSLANTVAIFSKRVQKHLINGTKIFILKEVGSRCENLVVKICDLPRFSLIPLKEFWDLPGHHPSEEVDIYCGDMSLTITKTTPSGRIPFYNLLRKLFSSFEKGNSWNGTWRIEDVFVDPITYQIEIIKAFCGRCNFGTMQNDLRRCVTGVIPEFNCGGHLPAFFTDLKCTLDEFVPERQLNPATWKKFRDFVIAHLSLKPPLTRSNFFDNLHEMMQSLDDGGRKILQSILTAGYLLENDWGAFFKNKSGLNPMFAVVYEHNKKKKEKIDQERKADTGKKKKRGARNAGCNTAGSVQGGGSAQEQQSQAPVEKPEQVEVFEKALEGLLIFSRHVKQHGTQGSRDKHGEQTLERLSEIDLVTSHYLEELIAIVHQLIYEIDHEDLDMDSVDYKKFRTMFEEIFEEYNAPEAVPLLNRQNEVETFAFFEHNENRAFTIEDPRQEMVDLQDVKAGLQKNDCAGGEGVKPIFSGAIIEVCMRMLVFYPEVVGFLEGEKDDFPYVEARYSLDSPPKLIMLDDKGEHKETISIGNWKRENIRQFLKEKVKPVKSSS